MSARTELSSPGYAEWRRRVLAAPVIVAGDQSDESGDDLYPVFDPGSPGWWLGAYRRKSTAERAARRMMGEAVAP